MKTHPAWSYDRYLPLDRADESGAPYIRQLLPGRDSLSLCWNGERGTLHYSARGANLWHAVALDCARVTLRGLLPRTEYELFIETDSRRSDTRLFRTGEYPGIMVNYLHPDDEAYAFSGRYLCSPAFCRTPDGALCATMDVYASSRPQNLTLVFRSEDDGAHWEPACELFPCFWGALFTHRGALYKLGMSNEYGDLLIGRSDDGGRSWSAPTVLFRGSCCTRETGLHCAPMPVVEHAGRLWTEIDYGAWACGRFASGLVSADADGDLLDPASWVCTGFLPHDPHWTGALPVAGAIEGNAVVLPDGGVGALLRYAPEKALLLRGDPDAPEAPLAFDAVVDFPFGHTKFQLRRLPDGRYLAVGNPAPDRRTLALSRSDDLRSWSAPETLIDGGALDPAFDAHQYPDCFVEDGALIVLSRTARNGAHSFHDSNCITFHRFGL